jgi:hypothetical protein
MSQTEYTKRLGKIIAKLEQLIEEGRKIKRPERVNVNMSKWTLSRLQLLASYRGVTLSTAADEAIKKGLGYIEADILSTPDIDWDEYEREMEEQNRIYQEKIEEGIEQPKLDIEQRAIKDHKLGPHLVWKDPSEIE